jgi:hypothetical protein
MPPPPVGLQTLGAGSLIIPMDLSYQATGMFQAYGLIYQLLRQNVDVLWMIEPSKTWHAAACRASHTAINPSRRQSSRRSEVAEYCVRRTSWTTDRTSGVQSASVAPEAICTA